jgi:hypothetical protein
MSILEIKINMLKDIFNKHPQKAHNLSGISKCPNSTSFFNVRTPKQRVTLGQVVATIAISLGIIGLLIIWLIIQ